MTERARWAWLVVVLIAGLGGAVTSAILYTNTVERRQQRDLCEMLRVFDDPHAPPATTERGRAQQRAIAAYRAKRC